MKFKLIQESNENYSPLEQILFNRGIEPTEFQHYLNTTDEDINSFMTFGEKELRNAAVCLINCIRLDKSAIICVD